MADGLITLAIGVLAYLLAAAAIDHWMVVGGLGFWGRLWLWLVLVGAAGTYFAVRLLPPVIKQINPLFAAATIERSQPSLKNSLINFLLLRGRRQEVVPIVYQAMEHRAAADLVGLEMDVAVDRTRVIRLGYVLLAVVAVFGLYLTISPKSSIRSAARVLWPWSSIEAPTRVTIREIQPGDAVAFYGDFVTISAEVAGLREGEPASVIYSTADGQTIDQAIPMTRPQGEYRYQCRLPPDNPGLQQDLTYHLAAGDCQTGRYRIEAQVAPTIVIDKVSYHYPSYTGLADRTVQRQGDLLAIEGTEVDIYATANTEIKPGTAEIDRGCAGQHGLRMTSDGRSAVGHFTLRLNPNDPARAEYESYQLRFADLQGRENQRPIRHRVEVIRDLPPEVRLVEPQKDEVQVAVDGELAIKVWARDPDFGLRRVTLRAQRDGKDLPIGPLLEAKKPEKAGPGEFSGAYAFRPDKLGLKAGDRADYWAEAEDTKEPTPGQTASGRQRIVVVGPEKHQAEADGRPGESKGDKQAGQKGRAGDKAGGGDRGQSAAGKEPTPGEGQPDQRRNESSERPQADGQPDSSQSGQSAGKQGSAKPGKDKGQAQGGEQSAEQQQDADKPNERIDPDVNPGDAVQEILNDRQKKQGQPAAKQSKPDRQPSEDQQTGQQQSGQQQQAGEQSGKGTSAGQSADGKKGSGEGSGSGRAASETVGNEKKGDEQTGSEKTDGEKAGGEKAGSEKAGGEKTSSEKAGGEKSGGEKAGSEKAGGEKSGGEKAGGEKAGGEKAGGQKAGGQKTGGEKADASKGEGEKSDAGKTDAQKGDGQQGSKQQPSGQQPSGENPSNEKPGADMAGGKKSGSAAGEEQPKSPDSQQSADQEKSSGQQPGEPSSPGAGKKVDNDTASPAAQNDNQDRQKKPGKAGETPGQQKPDTAQSPSTSQKQSDSQGETAGDRSGGGQQGGGQQANQSGEGGPGKHTPADEGGSQAAEPGEGQIGNKAGQQAVSKNPTGSAAKTPSDKATSGSPASDTSGGKPSGETAGGKPSGESTSDQPGQTPGATAGGRPPAGVTDNPAVGGGGSETGAAKPPKPSESPADEANLEYANRQTELALEYLRDQVAKEKSPLLERLGWTKDDARRFLERWEAMRRAAAEPGPAGQSARKRLDDALRSLGLRPRGTELRHGGLKAEPPQNLRDAGRFPPPPDWADQLREYSRGVSGSQRK
jgi:hypothetical protein